MPEKKLQKLTPIAMRAFALIFIGTVFSAIAFVGYLQGTFSKDAVQQVIAENGTLHLQANTFNNRLPLYLNGQWEYFPGILCIQKTFDTSLLIETQKKIVTLPLNSITESAGPATYRLRIVTDIDIAGFSFFLPHYSEKFAIYVNGTQVMPVEGLRDTPFLYTMSDFLFRIETPIAAGPVDIIISANVNEDQALLFRRPIVFGPADIVSDYVANLWRDETFLIGMVTVLAIIGLVFMLMRATFGMLTNITLFDTFLAVRILLGFTITSYFLHEFFPALGLSNLQIVSLQYAMFFIAGAFGCVLSKSIWDSASELPKWPIRLQILICLSGSVFTVIFFKDIPLVCILALFVVFVFSFAIVIAQIHNHIKKGRNSLYYTLQTIKTIFIGTIMSLDIIFFQGTDFNVFVYAYVLFLIAHLIARLGDSNASYRQVENLNHNLEAMIEDRTQALTEANKRLSEISLRDPLTQAYNRLYFEGLMEKTLQEYKGESLYLCMLDLDHFKSINDRFGHLAGDEQLKHVVQTINTIIHDTGALARVGGEEFVILFVGIPDNIVKARVESIRKALENDAKKNPKRTTGSFGLVEYHAGYTQKDFLKFADKCLYAAKEQGRNQIVSMGSPLSLHHTHGASIFTSNKSTSHSN